MKSLKFTLMCLTIFLTLLLYSQSIFAQDTNEDLFDRRHAVFGWTSNADVHSLNLNASVPVKQIGGGLSAGLVRTISDGEAIADELDASVEAGYESTLFQVKGFVNFERSLQKGTDLSREIGAYLGTPELKLGSATLEFGVGSFFENVQVRESLGLESENARRILGFTKVSVGKLGVFVETTPKIQLDDIELSIRPQYLVSIGSGVSVRFDGEFDYTSQPLIENDYWANRLSVSADIEF